MRTFRINTTIAACMAIATVLFPPITAAQNGTWITNASGNWSDSSNWAGGTIADGSTNSGDFSQIDITDDLTVTLDTDRTIGHLSFDDADTNSAADWRLNAAGISTLTFSGGGTITATEFAPGKGVELNVPLAGGETISVRGGGHVNFSAINTMNGHMYVGTSDDGNTATFSVTGLTVPSPGRDLLIGRDHKFNTMIVTNGCIARWRAGVEVGRNFGSDSNTLIVTGSGSQVIVDNNGGSQFNLGVSGAKGNRVEVRDGGYLRPQKFVIGRLGGMNSVALITGAGSLVRAGAGNQGCVNVGTDTGGTSGNSVTIENGGHLLYESPEYKSGGSIGDSNGADNNYIRVNAGGTFSFLHSTSNSLPFVIGGYNGRDGNNYQSFPIDSNANGNHLDIFGGGSFITANASVYVMGVNSAINLGDGDGMSQAKIAATALSYNGAAYSPGIVLYKQDARLRINSGRLQAAAGGPMVSGPGDIELNGPAEFFTTNATSSIDSTIMGNGDLTKLGPGTLALNATNTYAGATLISEGALRLTHDHALSEETDVYITSGAKIDLNFSGENTIHALYIDGQQKEEGPIGKDRYPQHITGTGYLRTLTGLKPSGFLFVLR